MAGDWGNGKVPRHPAELLDSVKLLLTDAKSHVFEIDPVLKSILSRFLYQNFIHFGQVVCLLHGFEVKPHVSPLSRFSIKIQSFSCQHFISFLNNLSYLSR